jgi:hypothetical protein
MVFAELLRGGKRGIRPAGDVGVYVCPQTKNGTDLLVKVVLENGKMRSTEDGISLAIFKLQTYDGKLEKYYFLCLWADEDE